MSRRQPSPILYASVAFVMGVFVGMAILSAPFWYYTAQREWFFYENRNNPPCHWAPECIPFALSHCTPPDFIVACRHKNELVPAAGVCICGAPGLHVRLELEYRDAGVDASR